MNYKVILSPTAEADLVALSPHLLTFVETHLNRLAQSPASLSRRVVSPPYPPGGQVYEFDQDIGEETWHHFAVFFRYGEDEATLYIIGVGHAEYRRGQRPRPDLSSRHPGGRGTLGATRGRRARGVGELPCEADESR